MEPFSISAIFAGISVAFQFADYAIRIAEVGSANEVFVRTIQIVRNDLNEAQRLLSLQSIQQKLISTPSKLGWIEHAIQSARTALYEIGKWVERPRQDKQATGTIKFETRVRWVFHDHKKILNHQTELSACHQQLSNVLAFLTPLEDAKDGPDPPYYGDVTFFDDLISPRQLRMQKMRQASASNTREETAASKPSTLLLWLMPNQQLCVADAKSEIPLAEKSKLWASEASFGSLSATSLPERIPVTTSNITGLRTLSTSAAPTSAVAPSSSYPSSILSHLENNPWLSIEETNLRKGQGEYNEAYAYMDRYYQNTSFNDRKEPFTLSGTNYSGPVDPLELLCGPSGMRATAPGATSHFPDVCELPGGTVSSLLPSNDPEPLPSYSGHRTHGELSGLDMAELPGNNHPRTPFSKYTPPIQPPMPTQSADHAIISTPLRPDIKTACCDVARSLDVPKTETTSSIRMRNQKAYMDILNKFQPT